MTTLGRPDAGEDRVAGEGEGRGCREASGEALDRGPVGGGGKRGCLPGDGRGGQRQRSGDRERGREAAVTS
jgi:hypothetical protein